MEFDIVDAALRFIAAYGLVAILILLVLDAAMLLPVFPGEVVLVMAVASHAHDLQSLVVLILLTAAAGLVGSLLLYAITRGGGRRLVEKYPRLFMMPRRRRERLERTFKRPLGQSLVLFMRLVPLTRVLVNIPAGLARMPIVRFVVLSAVGLLAYHAAFLWFAYEVRRPGSTLGTQKEQLQAAYGDPAMEFVAANAILSALVLILLGAIVSVRASRAMLRDPEESTGSLFGWLATMALLWGGAALGIVAYLDPGLVVLLARPGGIDIEALAARAGVGVVPFLSTLAAVLVLVGALLRAFSGRARARRRKHLKDVQWRQAMAASRASRSKGGLGGPSPGPQAPKGGRPRAPPQRPAALAPARDPRRDDGVVEFRSVRDPKAARPGHRP